jgi:hypothetical protein
LGLAWACALLAARQTSTTGEPVEAT